MVSDLHAALAGSELRRQREPLIDAVMQQLLERGIECTGEEQQRDREKSRRDIGYHFDYLREALQAADPALFVQYAGWAQELLVHLGFPAAVLVGTLQAMRDASQQTLAPPYGGIAGSYVSAALQQVEAGCLGAPPSLPDDGPLATLAQEYLAALLQGDRRGATQQIMAAVENGVGVRDIYLHVFQRTQHEVGRLWQLNRISVAQEHYCTAATQLIMSQLYPYVFATERCGRRMVATSVGGELHEIGIRMVADFFEMEGWDTYYLGANTPASSVVQAIAEYRADVLAISATLTPHLPKVVELIEQVRHSSVQPKILVGGHPFNLSRPLWQKVGADGYAPNAEEAVRVGLQLVV